MGHSLSASKRERQNVHRQKRNRTNMATLRVEIKRVKAEVDSGTADAGKTLAAAFKALDRAARKHAIPKKRANRKKSRLALALNRAAAAKAAGAPTPV
jgi:small subunit ribosomal protein S20